MAEGQLLGCLPNVEWGACSFDEIRLLFNFQGLPPVSSIIPLGRASYRYVRQEDPLWSQLHQGVLTTGYLPQSLGFFEPLSAKKLGLPRSRISHRHLLAAYQRLLLPHFVPQSHAGKGTAAAAAAAAATLDTLAEGATAAEAAAELHNAQATADFNAGKPCVAALRSGSAAAAGAAPQANGSLEPGSAAAKHSSSSGSSSKQPVAASQQLGPQLEPQRERSQRSNSSAPYFVLPPSPSPSCGQGSGGGSSSKQKKRRSRRKQGSSEGQREEGTAAVSGAALRGAAQLYPGRPSEEQKLKLARSLGQQGLDAVCCTWGKAQEPASLHALASLLPPTSQLVEVGLCQLEPHLDLPPEWGFTSPGALPPLGASPDALLRHAVGAMPAAGPAAAAGLLAPPAAAAREVGTLAAGPAGALVTLVKEAAAAGGPTAAAGPTDGAAAAAAAAAGDAVAEAAASEESEGEAGMLPGATAACRDGDGSVGGADLAGVEEELLGLQLEGEERDAAPGACSGGPDDQLQTQEGGRVNGSGSSGGSRGSNQDGLGVTAPAVPQPRGQVENLDRVQYLVEVVEVKNVCPFGLNQRRGGRRKPAKPYLVADRGPRQEIKPEWVPQLQQHMLCSGTRSAVLLSRSATRGVRMFRMSRDDEYLALMLRVLGRFWREHVLPRRPPPPDMFASWAEYHALLARTVALARAAPLVLEVPSPELQQPAGADLRFFLG